MTAQSNDPPRQTLRRIVPPAHQRAQQDAAQVETVVDDEPNEDGLYDHPSNYVKPGARRWHLTLCSLEEVKPSKVREWDERENGKEIVRWRVQLRRLDPAPGSEKTKWNTVSDETRASTASWDDLTIDYIRDTFGPGAYRVHCYPIVLDEHEVAFHLQARVYSVGVLPKLAPKVDAPPAAPQLAPAVRSEATMKPSSFQEWVQWQEIQQRAEERAEDRRIRLMRDEEEREERRARLRRDDDERRDREEDRRRARAREDEDRRDREDQRRRERAKEEREEREREEDRKTRRAEKIALDAAELARTERADPVKHLEQQMKLLENAKTLFGGDSEPSPKGAMAMFAQLADMAKPLGPVLDGVMKRIVGDMAMSDRQKIAELELQVRSARAELEFQRMRAGATPAAPAPAAPPPKQHADSRIKVTEVPPQPKPAEAEPSPPVGVEVKSADAPDLKPGDYIKAPDELPPGAPCPACGLTDGCEHYPADAASEATEEGEDDEEDCDRCPECPHGDDAPTNDEGDCTLCPPCPHDDEEDAAPASVVPGPGSTAPGVPLTPPNVAIAPATAQLPPVGGFVGVQS